MKFLFVFAHPDDESFSSGGTIARLAKQGHMVKLTTATRGEAGEAGDPPICKKEELGKVREKELKNASKILGISKIYFLGFKDGALSKVSQKLLAEKIYNVLSLEKPDVVVTFNKEGGSRHPDHIAISKCVTYSFIKFMNYSKKHVRLYHTAIPKSLLSKLAKDGMGYKVFGKIKGTSLSKITTIVDISKFIDLKIKAIKSHKTQNKDWQRYLKRRRYKEFNYEYFTLIAENSII